VKRVLCRYHAIEQWSGETETIAILWQLAEQYTPTERVADYTQAIMDLGATVCTRTRPLCTFCPLNQDCTAYQQGQPSRYPKPKPSKTLPCKKSVFIMVHTLAKQVLLQKRPQKGIWGGLWSFPECTDVAQIETWCHEHLKSQHRYTVWSPLRHTFTHFHLDITPVHVHLSLEVLPQVTLPESLWYDLLNPPTCGLATPVVRLLTQLTDFTIGK
jgi:A/G-specific adenine glycosylase